MGRLVIMNYLDKLDVHVLEIQGGRRPRLLQKFSALVSVEQQALRVAMRCYAARAHYLLACIIAHEACSSARARAGGGARRRRSAQRIACNASCMRIAHRAHGGGGAHA